MFQLINSFKEKFAYADIVVYNFLDGSFLKYYINCTENLKIFIIIIKD
jgi:hypothetical protein